MLMYRGYIYWVLAGRCTSRSYNMPQCNALANYTTIPHIPILLITTVLLDVFVTTLIYWFTLSGDSNILTEISFETPWKSLVLVTDTHIYIAFPTVVFLSHFVTCKELINENVFENSPIKIEWHLTDWCASSSVKYAQANFSPWASVQF